MAATAHYAAHTRRTSRYLPAWCSAIPANWRISARSGHCMHMLRHAADASAHCACCTAFALCVCVCVCMYVFCVCVFFVNVYAYVCLYVCVLVCMCLFMYMRTSMSKYAYVCIYVHVWVFAFSKALPPASKPSNNAQATHNIEAFE
jgi:hypothetical protein